MNMVRPQEDFSVSLMDGGLVPRILFGPMLFIAFMVMWVLMCFLKLSLSGGGMLSRISLSCLCSVVFVCLGVCGWVDMQWHGCLGFSLAAARNCLRTSHQSDP